MVEKNTKEIPALTKKKVFQEWNSTCAFCTERDVSALEIHHIVGREDGGSNSETNLILVCSNCHSKITAGEIPMEVVIRKKMEGTKSAGHTTKTAPTNSNIIFGNFNNSVVAGTLNVEKLTVAKGSRTPKMNAPEGSIGADLEKLNYIKRLIDRYIEFKRQDVGKDAIKPVILYQAIKREFKASYNLIPVSRFAELAGYLTKRIDGTKLGRVKKSRGQRRYSSFEEFRNHVNGGFNE
jgi:hypothetical protein